MYLVVARVVNANELRGLVVTEGQRKDFWQGADLCLCRIKVEARRDGPCLIWLVSIFGLYFGVLLSEITYWGLVQMAMRN